MLVETLHRLDEQIAGLDQEVAQRAEENEMARRLMSVIGAFDRDPAMRMDRLASGLAEFPSGRHLTFTCATQFVPTQRVLIVGTQGRLEIQLPFNPRRDQLTRLVIDDGRDLIGTGEQMEEFPPQISINAKAMCSPALS